MKRLQILAVLIFLGATMQSCCEPEYKDSFPQVLFDTYRDSVVKDRLPPGEGVTVVDSGYYPIYEFKVRNEGADADTFTMVIGKDGFNFAMSQFVMGGETVTFRTPGPVPDTAALPAQWLYFSMFRQDPEDLAIQELDPDITFHYGEVFKGDEGCNTPSSRHEVDARLFR